MGLTMEQVMDLDIMGNAIMKTSRECLKGRNVEWVSVTETPVENFVRNNELVLTTGMGCGNDPVLFRRFVEDIINSKASGLAIATGRHTYYIDRESIEFAQENQFPIIEIPWEIRFADITKAVTRKINELQQKDFEHSQRTQQHMLNLILQGADLNALARYTSEKISAPILITNRQGARKGASFLSRKLSALWDQLLGSNIIPQEQIEEELSNDPFQTKVHRVEAADDRIILQLPIVHTTNKKKGYLFVLLKENESPEEYFNYRRLVVLEHAVTAAALWFLRESAVEETELRLREDFVWNLARGQMGTWSNVLSRSKALGYDIELPYQCISGTPENLKELYNEIGKKEQSYRDWLQSMIHFIEDEIYYTGESIQRKTMVTYQEGMVIIFLEVPIDNSRETVNNFLNLIERRLMNLLPGVIMSWGIGTLHVGEIRFSKSFEEAEAALRIGKKRKGAGHRSAFSETRMDRILLSLAENEEVRDIVSSTIKPLTDYEKQRKMDLIDTFMAYYENQSKVSQTARALNLHRQSLLYRLRKIESLTGLSLANPDDVFLMDLSIRIWKIGLAEIED
ncbi:PucR family transcriptional regulator ligand-binding domain-containing protein [Evansella sp. LMS18]|uniref:PucR family transcriptional regulator n=1 Tax=Evansella sp. LMS18 TaxID=2924033 RepID=UPI0020D02E3A|nr:PucR family transcriptional regulator [Evansella sp. LMS18]UTR10442.1 PucR family transcriptional regulator ligand-binding domain-containing protein [Evansella sp. LMS18]